MATIAVSGYEVVAAGAYGSGQPDRPLTTIADYLSWYAQWIPDSIVDITQQWQKPRELTMCDLESGGILLFAPILEEGGEPWTQYEYRFQADGEAMTDWLPCASFRLSIPNAAFAIGSIHIRHVATAGKLASPILTNRSAFTEHIYPLIVLSYHFEGTTLHTIVKVGIPTSVRIATNGYNGHDYFRHEDNSSLWQPGTYDFAFSFAGFEGQHQVIAFNTVGDPDFYADSFQVVVPFA